MNNTKTILTIVAIFMAATLVVGTLATTTTSTIAITQSAYAYNKKDNGKGNGNGNTVTIEECKNKGSASGFDTTTNQECENLICTHPGENATCVQEGVSAVQQGNQTTPVKLTCEQCLTTILSQGQITTLQNFFSRSSIADLCALFGEEPIPESSFTATLVSLGISPTTASELIACLKDAGIVFF